MLESIKEMDEEQQQALLYETPSDSNEIIESDISQQSNEDGESDFVEQINRMNSIQNNADSDR